MVSFFLVTLNLSPISFCSPDGRKEGPSWRTKRFLIRHKSRQFLNNTSKGVTRRWCWTTLFLDKSSHLYKSVRWPVRPSIDLKRFCKKVRRSRKGLNKAHKANDASSWWWNDCTMMWLHEICLVYLLLQLFARKLWFSLFFTKAWPTDRRTDGRTDPLIEMRGRI